MAEGSAVALAIRTMRQRANLSARSLSRLAGLSESYVTKVEAGQLEPSLTAFSKLAVALKMTPHEVYFCIVQASSQ